MHGNNSSVVNVLKDGNFIVDGQDGVVVSPQELLLEYFDRNECAILKWASKVDLARVALSKGLDDFILVVENGVRRALAISFWLHWSYVIIQLAGSDKVFALVVFKLSVSRTIGGC